MTFVEDVLLTAAAVFVLTSLVGVFRIVRGPTMPDRVIAVNVVGSNVVIVIALLAAAIGEPGALDIALVYALLNFLLSIAISKFTVERGGVL
ncbi:cation:proton antiporter [Halogeometricum sp. S1BR25-6]|uniref:Cation:proton antiporter n=1 Tax=Halogeometricum salsisoli TaxID=2950536 RepID=A0ABU2GDP4_9EURY|nr:cation:proton antiporter [Halogeometricum sp. S1BR25-6]MDS0298299.1 cation:proton antiporter [Halogeometricum sp. S1BR25-6]